MTTNTTTPQAPTKCQWFYLCTNDATTTRLGPGPGPDGKPSFVDVPICDRCAKRVDAR